MSKQFKIYPLAGIDNTSKRDDALQVRGDAPATYVRDAVNVDIDEGRASMRPGRRQVCNTPYTDLWRSSLHGDLFGRLGGSWVRINPQDWGFEVLASVGEQQLHHVILNNLVAVAGANGIFTFNGQRAQPLALPGGWAPMLAVGAGSLPAGQYGFASAWLRDGQEGSLSPLVTAQVPDNGAVSVGFPAIAPEGVTGIRLFMTRHQGGQLLRVGDFDHRLPGTLIPAMPQLGAAPLFEHMHPMPSGQYLAMWQGRLVVAQGRTLRFSQAMAYHVHDRRYDFADLPQRITFVAPVGAGIFVGQVDNVVFLSGQEPKGLTLNQRATLPPVPGSAIALDSQTARQFGEGGRGAVAWLAGNGFVLGTDDGAIIQPQANRISGVAGSKAVTVANQGRLVSAVI